MSYPEAGQSEPGRAEAFPQVNGEGTLDAPDPTLPPLPWQYDSFDPRDVTPEGYIPGSHEQAVRPVRFFGRLGLVDRQF